MFGVTQDEVDKITTFFKPEIILEGEYFLKTGRFANRLGFIQSYNCHLLREACKRASGTDGGEKGIFTQYFSFGLMDNNGRAVFDLEHKMLSDGHRISCLRISTWWEFFNTL